MGMGKNIFAPPPTTKTKPSIPVTHKGKGRDPGFLALK